MSKMNDFFKNRNQEDQNNAGHANRYFTSMHNNLSNLYKKIEDLLQEPLSNGFIKIKYEENPHNILDNHTREVPELLLNHKARVIRFKPTTDTSVQIKDDSNFSINGLDEKTFNLKFKDGEWFYSPGNGPSIGERVYIPLNEDTLTEILDNLL